MRYSLSPSALVPGYPVSLPASKSISNRALILQVLSGSPSVGNLSDSDDTAVMLRALRGGLRGKIDIGAAGTSMRFLTAYLAATPGTDVTLTGSERMLQRPIGILVDSLRALGADIRYAGNEGFPPLQIRGRQLRGGILSMDGSVSSQFISALLMVAPTFENGLELHLEGKVTSVPYIEMTLEMMRRFGVNASWNSEQQLISVPADAEYKVYPGEYTVESDWSGASYWYEIAALSEQPVRLRNLPEESLQGDAAIRDYFLPLGVLTEFRNNDAWLTVHPSMRKEKITLDLASQPDMAQTFVTACCALGVRFEITGLHTLRIKETDRIAALETELRKLGYVLTDRDNDVLIWDGTRCEAAERPVIDTYKDHRMALAFAPLCLTTERPLEINDPAVVSKSYPEYWQHLRAFGINIREQ